MSGSWFPLYQELMEDDRFRRLTPTEKVFMWHLVSQFNERNGKPFYRPDKDVAALLNTTTRTLSTARKRLAALDWAEHRNGFIAGNRRLTTTYKSVKWSVVKQGADGVRWAKMPRDMFEALLRQVRRKELRHGDLVVYVYLCYWEWLHPAASAEDAVSFWIQKRDLCNLTGLEDAPARVERLRNAFAFSNGDRLFELSDQRFKLSFHNWAQLVPERSQEILGRIRQEFEDSLRSDKLDTGAPGKSPSHAPLTASSG